MRTLTVRLPEQLVAEIEAESRRRKVSRSDVMRERLAKTVRNTRGKARGPTMLELAGDLIGSVSDDGLTADLSANKKKYLREWGYGKARDRR